MYAYLPFKVFYSYPLPRSHPSLKRYYSQLQCGLLHFRIRSSALPKVWFRAAAEMRLCLCRPALLKGSESLNHGSHFEKFHPKCT